MNNKDELLHMVYTCKKEILANILAESFLDEEIYQLICEIGDQSPMTPLNFVL